MQYQKFDNYYLLLIEKDQEIISTIETLVIKEQIGAAQITMLGSITDVTLGYIPKNDTNYNWKTFTDQYELVNGTGLIAWDTANHEPLIHCHITISDDDFQTFAGHLKTARVAIMAEVMINLISNEKVKKALNPDLNLKTLVLTNN